MPAENDGIAMKPKDIVGLSIHIINWGFVGFELIGTRRVYTDVGLAKGHGLSDPQVTIMLLFMAGFGVALGFNLVTAWALRADRKRLVTCLQWCIPHSLLFGWFMVCGGNMATFGR